MHFNIDDKYLQTIAHLYRAEINRLTIYRQRLDVIFNWYMMILSTVIIYYLGNQNIYHNIIVILFLPNLLFSFIEARRYRYYMLSQYRTRLIEKGFYCDILDIIESQDDTNYKLSLYNSLLKPEYNISFYHAWIIRTRRNYIWLLYLIISVWIIKLVFLKIFISNIIIICTLSGILIIFHLFINNIKIRSEIDL